jgi:nitric oxide dioxygenase
LEKLNEAVAIISHKHVSFNIPAEYYEDIGMDLIQAIKDVLGKDATEPIVKAWEEGYDFLANVFIDMEYKMRKDNMKKIGTRIGSNHFVLFETSGWISFATLQVWTVLVL